MKKIVIAFIVSCYSLAIYGQIQDLGIFGLYSFTHNKKCGLGSFLFINADTSVVDISFSKGSFSFQCFRVDAKISGDTLDTHDYWDFLIRDDGLYGIDYILENKRKPDYSLVSLKDLKECRREQFQQYGIEIVEGYIRLRQNGKEPTLPNIE